MSVIGNEPKMGTLSLSRGQDFWFTSYLRNGNFPEGTTAHIDITDTAGGLIASVVGDVAANRIVFSESLGVVDLVPHGANYELFVMYDDGATFKIEYGTVVRGEARYPDAAPLDISATAMYYGDDFQRTLLGPKWLIKSGTPKIYVNGGGLLNGVASSQQLFSWTEKFGMIYYAPLNGDDLTIHCKFINLLEGMTTMVFCSDYNMTSYLGVQVLDSWLGLSNKIRIVKGTGPYTVTSVASVDSVTDTDDTFLIKYNSLTDSVSVFKNNSTTALLSYTDSSHTVPHGAGFRYLGINGESDSLFSTGPQVTSWTAKDGL